jgi:2-amino-4-hydroxy-6-hydroxymethyldihydropteridine diphosphokinase
VIFLGLGANLPSPIHGGPLDTLKAALVALAGAGVTVKRCSRFYRSAPVPASDQPWYLNAIAEVASDLHPAQLMTLLHEIEANFGRTRSSANAPRVLDLDLLIHGERVSGPGEWPCLPHPRLSERAFVLLPLAELAPDWRHPRTGRCLAELIEALPRDQLAEPMM